MDRRAANKSLNELSKPEALLAHGSKYAVTIDVEPFAVEPNARQPIFEADWWATGAPQLLLFNLVITRNTTSSLSGEKLNNDARCSEPDF